MFQQQAHEIGWDKFYKGHISTLWGDAHHQAFLQWNQHSNRATWTSDVIKALLSSAYPFGPSSAAYSTARWRS